MRRVLLIVSVVVWCACERIATVPPSAVAPQVKPEKKAELQPKADTSPAVAPKVELKQATADVSSRAPVAQLQGGVAKKDLSVALGMGTSAGGAVGGEAHGMGGLGLRGVGSGGGGKGMAVGYGHGAVGVVSSLRTSAASAPVESYGAYGINSWVETTADHLSTFAADVDTASYAIARRKLREGSLPPPSSVRVEEFVNYFRYTSPQPEGTLGVTLEAVPSPLTPGKHLLRIGVQGRRLGISERKAAHLTFLVDVSGSMQSADKLPLAKRALRLLVDNLRDGDTVALVTYAGGVRLVLPHTGMEKKAVIHEAIESLSAGGSTAMASGIELAYQQAAKALDDQSFSRVVIVSDGDANVGATSHAEILKLIQRHVKEGVTVTTVGFGMGNYRDDLMEQFSNKGNGNHAYVDSMFEAKKVFQTELGSTLEMIAKDVKLQVDFDPAQVKRYRLIGYENRDIADADFRNDKVDAGEIGSGHTVTALYELELKEGAGAGLCTVRVRAKQPRSSEAIESTFPFAAASLASRFDAASPDLRFATAVMAAAEVFRQSPHAKTWSYRLISEIARSAAGESPERREFVDLLERARAVVEAQVALAPRADTR